jgi:hypothetical protein
VEGGGIATTVPGHHLGRFQRLRFDAHEPSAFLIDRAEPHHKGTHRSPGQRPWSTAIEDEDVASCDHMFVSMSFTSARAIGYGRRFPERDSERPWPSHERSWEVVHHPVRVPCFTPRVSCGAPAYCLQTFASAVSKSLKENERMMMGVKVFTATKAREREMLGDVITRWLADNPRARVVDKIVTQSSDSQFHCLSITLFYSTEDT